MQKLFDFFQSLYRYNPLNFSISTNLPSILPKTPGTPINALLVYFFTGLNNAVAKQIDKYE